MGGNLGGLGDGPQNKIEAGEDPCICPPHKIFRSSVFGCARMYEQSKKWCHQGIFFWNSGFSREERVVYDILQTV